jgi:hypothetical protein
MQGTYTKEELFKLFMMASGTGWLYPDEGMVWMHRLESGDPESGDVYTDTKNGQKQIDDTDDDDDGVPDYSDDDSWADDFLDWLAGEDREGDGITYESERGHLRAELLMMTTMVYYGTTFQSLATQYSSGTNLKALQSKLKSAVKPATINAFVDGKYGEYLKTNSDTNVNSITLKGVTLQSIGYQ